MEDYVDCLGYRVFSGSLQEIPIDEDQIVINTINAYSYVVAKNDQSFKKALSESDILLPDGFPIVTATRILKGARIKKVAGEDIFFHLMKEVDKLTGRVFFLGAGVQTLNLIEKRVSVDYPNLVIETYSPPFKPSFSDAENDEMISAINNFNPDVLLVGMTAPKQEKWVLEHKHRLRVNVICAIGAVFDFYAGTVKRPSKFWIMLRLEWFVRFLREPRRLWKRYFYYSPQFMLDVIRNKFRIK